MKTTKKATYAKYGIEYITRSSHIITPIGEMPELLKVGNSKTGAAVRTMKKFEVGKWYGWAEPGFDPIKVMSRTEKSIVVNNGSHQWRMFIKIDEDGSEYVMDSKSPRSWREFAFKCSCKWEEM